LIAVQARARVVLVTHDHSFTFDDIVIYDDIIKSRLTNSSTLTVAARVGRTTRAEREGMTEQSEGTPNRLSRRKARTRAALVRAAQTFIAAGKTNVPVLEITQAADIGMGSFYNHFESKEQLYEAAVVDALDAHGALLDELTTDLDDPAHVFAQRFRLTGRLHRRNPELSEVLLNNGLAVARSDKGLAPRARRDIEAAARSGRFTVRDPELALVTVAGAVLCLGQFLRDHPERPRRRDRPRDLPTAIARPRRRHHPPELRRLSHRPSRPYPGGYGSVGQRAGRPNHCR